MIRAFQWDLARQVERLDVLLQLLPRYAAWGFQELYLHLEDSVQYPSLPGIGRQDAYRYEELCALVERADHLGIRVVPIANLLGHTQYLIRHPEYRDLNELRDDCGAPLASGQICPLHPRFPEVAGALLRDLAPCCRARKVHVGLDESFHLGRCPRCREEVARLGLAAHFAGHVARLHALARSLGLELGMWADMLYFVPEAIPLLPQGITAYDWYYYPFGRKPRVEFYNFAERDLAPALRRQGIRYYGCPMNGAFRHEPMPVFGDRLANIRSWWQRCTAVQADGLLITSWEAYRLALETTTVVDAAAAGLWLEDHIDDATSLLAHGLARVTGTTHHRAQARALLAADAHAFAGYARWQINDRWDVFAGNESLNPYVEELRIFARMAAAPVSWSPALTASIDFRIYLARRDIFVRQAARRVFRCRRLLAAGAETPLRNELLLLRTEAAAFADAIRAGMAAARRMWRLTRLRGRVGQNEVQLRRDRERLAEWRKFLRSVARKPEALRGATPVCGRWQLQFTVHNFAPAVARVIVEEKKQDGTWREIASRHTIEFRASAARPTARIRREFTAPVSAGDAELRVRIGGVGRVRLSHVTLTDGCERRIDARFRSPLTLGRPAVTRGLPDPFAVGSPKLLRFTNR